MHKLESARSQQLARKSPWNWRVRWVARAGLLTALTLGTLGDAHAVDLVFGARQRLLAPVQSADQQFGAAVAIDGDTAVVGARGDATLGDAAGALYIFVWSGTSWVVHPINAKITLSGGLAQDKFGSAVAISGDLMLVGAPGRSTDRGSVYVFRRASSTVTSAWSLEATLAPSLAAGDAFGDAVAFSGSSALIGAAGDGADSGAAYVFVRSGTTWAQQGGKLVAPTIVANAAFGVSVALDGDTAVIGAPSQTQPGAAFVFQRTGTTWSAGVSVAVTSPITPPAAFSRFGRGVAISGNWMAVGAPGAEISGILEAGSVYFFERTGSTWVSRSRFDTPNPADTGSFGRSVALVGNRAVVGAPIENSERGQAYLFERPAASWQLNASIARPNTTAFAGFGTQVALSSSSSALIGAPSEPCVGGVCTDAGAAYAFTIGLPASTAVPLLGPSGLLLLAGLLGACGTLVAARRLHARHLS